ncbi:hypothetical protein [Vibrio parahaemolyticus]|uniref:hypothetical protein n=1 Tax=Vibrio parahaemolyticus TaxID=670 RepID=UPI0033774C59
MKIVQQAVAQLEQVRVVSKSATTELFRRSGKYSNVTTVQLQGILMNWKATEKDFFLVASTKWGKSKFANITTIGFMSARRTLLLKAFQFAHVTLDITH